MKLLILGASGDVGRAVTREALSRGHQVTACARSAPPQTADSRVEYAALDVTRDSAQLLELMRAHDAAISALRPAAGQEDRLPGLTRAVLQAAAAAGTPVYVTGGAATLKTGEGSGHTVLTAPGFLPDAVRPIAEACAAQEALLNSSRDAKWICLRPPAMLEHGERTGRYALGRSALVRQPDGQSRISYADFAVAMTDLADLQPAPHQMLTAGW